MALKNVVKAMSTDASTLASTFTWETVNMDLTAYFLTPLNAK